MRQKVNVGLLFITIALALLSSCERTFEDKIEGNNNVVIEDRTVGDFNEMIVEGNFEVSFTLSNTASLRIEAEENLIPLIVTKVVNNNLFIEPKSNYRLDNNKVMKIFLTSPNMDIISLTGSTIVACDSLATDYLKIDITGSGKVDVASLDVLEISANVSGSGDIILEGNADRSNFEITGSGGIYTLDLQQNKCDAIITGSGNIYVHAEDYLKANIVGSGHIYYTGNPVVNKNVIGTGGVKQY